MRKTLISVLATVAFGCGGSGGEPPPEYPPVEEPEAIGVAPEPTPEPTPDPTPPPPAVTVVAGEHTPIEGEPPSLRILAPRNDQLIRRGPVKLRVQLRSWPLAADPGNHVHVILDNEPYIAVRDVSAPIDLNALVQENLQHELAPGSHVVRVFPSRAHHESVKLPGAFAMVTFHVGERTEGFELDASAPLLTYSRPKGCYPAGERILLDYFLTNAGEGMTVQYSVAGASGALGEWVPYWIENLAEGQHDVTLRLVDGDGQPVAGPFNDTTRSIRVGGCP
jgi:hypothetical protein